MTGKHRDGEQNPLERAHVSEKEGKVVSKSEYLVLKSSSACERMEGSGESHPVRSETAANGILHADQFFFFLAEVGMDLKITPLPISNWRSFGNNEGDSKEYQSGG